MKIIYPERLSSTGEQIANNLQIESVVALREQFSNGEVIYFLPEQVLYNEEVILLWDGTWNNANINLVELLLMIDVIRNNNPERIHLLLPSIPYGRQDRKFGSQQPMSLRLVADLLHTVDVSTLFTLDMHSPQSESAFQFSVYNLTVLPTLVNLIIEEHSLSDFVFVVPDMGSFKRVTNLARYYNKEVAIFYKQRSSVNVWVSDLLGEVAGKDVIIVEDMIDTGGTMNKCISSLKSKGVGRVFIAATHCIFSQLHEKPFDADYTGIYTTNSIKRDLFPDNTYVLQISDFYSQVLSVYFKERQFPTQFMEDSWFQKGVVTCIS